MLSQSCVILCDPMDCSLPGSSIHGTSQARTLECVAMFYSRGSFQPRDRTHVSCTGRQIPYHWATWESLDGCAVLSCSVVSDSSWPHDCSLPGSPVHGDFPSKNTEVGYHVLLQGNSPTQGLNPGLPHWREILYQLSYLGSLRILEWVAISSSRGSSPPRDRTHVSCTGRLILYHLPLHHLEITFIFYVYFCFVYKFICIIFF